MTYKEYGVIENHMLGHMRDAAHDRHHIYRVLCSAVDIAAHEENVDMDVLIAASLLHDIGRHKQAEDPNVCHAQAGSLMAYDFLLSIKWSEDRARHVKDCVSTHRYRADNPPKSLEAKILFDADKLDAAGAVGIARTLIYGGQTGEPLYLVDENGEVVTAGGGAEFTTFMQEYNYKLKNLYDSFHTKRAREIALERKKHASAFYDGLYEEVGRAYKSGMIRISEMLKG